MEDAEDATSSFLRVLRALRVRQAVELRVHSEP
jgi:hypothetical protein